MKKIIITALLVLSSSMYADMFESNTDMKHKYEFDIDVANKNQKLVEKLEKFQNGEATDEDIKVHLDAMADSEKKPFANDVKVDRVFERVDENTTDEDTGWFSWFPWFNGEEESVSVEIETPSEQEEVTQAVAPAEETNPQEGAE